MTNELKCSRLNYISSAQKSRFYNKLLLRSLVMNLSVIYVWGLV